MTHRVLTAAAVVFLVAAFSLSCRGEDAALKTLSAGGVSVSYPPSMEAQANRVLQMAEKHVQPSVEIHKQMIALFADPGAIAEEIANLLGADEVQDKTRTRLLAYKQKSEALVACFSNLRLVETAAAVATGGVDAGVLQVRYFADTDEFKMGLDLNNAKPEILKRSYFPIFVNADGKIRAEDKIPDMAVDFLGTSKAMLVAPVHETVAWLVTQQLGFYHPLARWFNEGVSAWVARRVLIKLDPSLTALADQVFLPSAASKRLRDKINLPAWPQASFRGSRDSDRDPALEVAHTQYSLELVTSILGANRSGALARIIGELKYESSVDTDAICGAIQEVTGTDPKKALSQYVPEDVAAGLKTGEPKKLLAQAEKLVQGKKWKEAADKLRRALQMNPADVNARLNLAWIERETGERADSEVQVFLAAGLLGQQKYSFHLIAPSVEGNYILGRLAILVGNLEYARKFLEPVLEAQPDHRDAKRALQEIRALETAAQGKTR